MDEDGNDILVADQYNNCIRKITPQGHVPTLASTGEMGHRDGEVTIAQFAYPIEVAVDASGNVIAVADSHNRRIHKITPQGQVSTGEAGLRDREGTIAVFCKPCGVAVDEGGNVIVADTDTVARFTLKAPPARSLRPSSSTCTQTAWRWMMTQSMLFDLAKLYDPYRLERLHNHCLHQSFRSASLSRMQSCG
jgi:DNA-binding beta-propeller fold protein YncE